MKIKNEYIKLKNGNKCYEFKNMILDRYLEIFARNSTDITYIGQDFKFNYVLFKLDEPILNVEYNSQIATDEFDIIIPIQEFEQKINNNNVNIDYYSSIEQNNEVYDIKNNSYVEFNYFNERKVCDIAFCLGEKSIENTIGNDKYIEAILDVSNYNLYLLNNQNLALTRRDIIETDAEFKSNSSIIPGPIHLAPCLIDKITEEPKVWNSNNTDYISFEDRKCSSILYSVGLSTDGKSIENEYVIGENVETTIEGSKITISEIPNSENDEEKQYLGNLGNTFLGHSYLMDTVCNYIILKYKLMQLYNTGTYEQLQEDYNEYQIPIDTGYYYKIIIPCDKPEILIGKLTLKINYERG